MNATTKKGFRPFTTPEEFVQAANETPAPEPVQSAPQPESLAAQATLEPPEVTDKPKTQATRQKAAKPAEGFPWDHAHPKLKEQFTLRLPQALHMKIKYLSEQSPQSMHDILLAAAEADVERRLRELGIKT